MQTEGLLKYVASEPERTVTRTVWIPPPNVLAKAAKPGGLMMTDLLSAAGRRVEQRDVRHILGAPAREAEIKWT